VDSRPASDAELDAVTECIALAFATDPIWRPALAASGVLAAGRRRRAPVRDGSGRAGSRGGRRLAAARCTGARRGWRPGLRPGHPDVATGRRRPGTAGCSRGQRTGHDSPVTGARGSRREPIARVAPGGRRFGRVGIPAEHRASRASPAASEAAPWGGGGTKTGPEETSGPADRTMKGRLTGTGPASPWHPPRAGPR
jgi:hypothetical protein